MSRRTLGEVSPPCIACAMGLNDATKPSSPLTVGLCNSIGGVTTPWVDFPSKASCVGLFVEAATRDGDAMAVVDDGEHSPDGVAVQLTYGTLLDKAR